MKSLENYIAEAFKINNNTKLESRYKYFPKNKKELEKNILEHFDQNIHDLNDIDVSKITDMNYLFGSFKNNFIEYSKKIDISLWDVSNVVTMKGMFCMSDFNGDISSWDVSNVVNMQEMFSFSKFTGENGDISQWNVSNVKIMRGMFSDSLFNGDISNWNVSNVEDMTLMFSNSVFDGKNTDLSNWNISKVLYMGSMFKGSKIDKNFLNQIKSWNISKCNDFEDMFKNTPFFRDESTINEISKLWNYPFND